MNAIARIVCIISVLLSLTGAVPCLAAPYAWTRRSTTGPSPRVGHAMAYDSARRVTVLFGGTNGISFYGDTWEWNGTAWTFRSNTGPSPRAYHGMAYDSARGVTVLVGGQVDWNYFGVVRDIWEWNGTAWLQRDEGGPRPPGAAYDTNRKVTVLATGDSSTQTPSTILEWDGVSWIGGDAHTHLIYKPAVAYDSARKVSVLFGGIFDPKGDVLEWDGITIESRSSDGVLQSHGTAMAYDNACGVTVMMGGYVCQGTLEWDGSTWRVGTYGGPCRYDHAMAYDSARRVTVMFGGYDTALRRDTWEYTGCACGAGTDKGKVIFPNGTPIRNAYIYAYYIDSGYLHRIDDQEEIITADDGTYTRPKAFCLRDQGAEPFASMKLGVLAEIRYDDPGLKAAVEVAGRPYNGEVIVNYPSNDPFAPQTKMMTGQEEIIVPYPTILHAGLRDGVVGMTYLGQYLRCDAGIQCDDVPGSLTKVLGKFPAFLTFTMPSQHDALWADDDVPWGYDNSLPWTTTQHDENILRLHDFVYGQVRNSLLSLVSEPLSASTLPINICAHSMGGTITRGWMHDHPNPPVARYVSFDGVHGGTTLADYAPIGEVLGFAEWSMNGYNELPGHLPTQLRWNYLHAITGRTNNLLLSSSCSSCKIVEPNCSAFGVGRTMKGVPGQRCGILLLLDCWQQPNGHSGRFISGWELHTAYGHSETLNRLDTVLLAVRYLTYGAPPEGATFSGHPSECVNSPPAVSAGNNGRPGTYFVRVSAGSMQNVDQPVILDTNEMLTISTILEGTDVSLQLLGPSGQNLTPDGVETSDLEGIELSTFKFDQPSVGQSTLRLVGGPSGARAAVSIEFSNQRRLEVELPDQPVVAGNTIPIVAAMRDSADQVIVGSGGTVEVSIERPDSNQVDIALFDDGWHGDEAANDGVYGNAFAATALGGRYIATVHAVIGFENETIERTTFGMFVVNSSPAGLVGISNERTVDEDTDGKMDFLDIDVNVAVVEPKRYLLSAVLLDSGGEQIAEVHQVFDGVGPASQTVTLRLTAADLVAHGTPGPWTLGSIELFDDEQILLVDTLPDYQTGAYGLILLETPPTPIVLRTVPDYGSLLGGGEIILQGQHFEHVSALLWDGKEIPDFEILDDSAIRFVVPPSFSCPQNSVEVQLTTPWGNSARPDVYNYSVMPGDFNVDGQVGLGDYGAFQVCAGGVGAIPNPPFPSCVEACRIAFDFDHDGDVDLRDFAEFQKLFSAPPP